jgi:hypothetical protein
MTDHSQVAQNSTTDPVRATRNRRFWTGIIWFVGVVVSLAVAAVGFEFSENVPAMNALIIGLILIVLTMVCETRVDLSNVETALEAELHRMKADFEKTLLGLSEDAAIAMKVIKNARVDTMFNTRYEELKQELKQLGEKEYRLEGRTAIYADDRSSIKLLQKGETLLSTCPVKGNLITDAMDHLLKDKEYEATMNCHIDAVKREVSVTRIYYFRRREQFEHEDIRKHLSGLVAAGLDIRVIFTKGADYLGEEYDFLVFGKRKVSIGTINHRDHTVYKGIVSIDPGKVADYENKYRYIEVTSQKLIDIK